MSNYGCKALYIPLASTQAKNSDTKFAFIYKPAAKRGACVMTSVSQAWMLGVS
jgi:hypothetical protein